MDKQEIRKRYTQLLVEHLGVTEDKITGDAHFVDDLPSDSLDAIEVIMAVEEEFNVEITDAEAEGLTTVNKVVEFLAPRVQ